MRQFFWIPTCVATIAVVFAIVTVSKMNADHVSFVEDFESAYAEPEIGTATQLTLKGAGSALSAAAFGLMALQPETYDGEIVLNIINASPLASRQKMELAAELRAAETGRADLISVLADVRVALAVE